MVATSIVARGLDVKDLSLVINYTVPNHYCLSPDTLVVLADGSHKACESVRKGDVLLGPSGKSAVVASNEPVPDKALFEIRTSAGSYRATGDHHMTVKWTANPIVSLTPIQDQEAGYKSSGITHKLIVRFSILKADGKIQHGRSLEWPVVLTDAGADDAEEEDVELSRDADDAREDEEIARLVQAGEDAVMEQLSAGPCVWPGCSRAAEAEPCRDCLKFFCFEHEHQSDHACPAGMMVPAGKGGPAVKHRQDTKEAALAYVEAMRAEKLAPGPDGKKSEWEYCSIIDLSRPTLCNGQPNQHRTHAYKMSFRVRGASKQGGISVSWLDATSKGGKAPKTGTRAELRAMGVEWLDALQAEAAAAGDVQLRRGHVFEITVDHFAEQYDKLIPTANRQHVRPVVEQLPSSVPAQLAAMVVAPVQADELGKALGASAAAAAGVAPAEQMALKCDLFARSSTEYMPLDAAVAAGLRPKVVYMLHNPLQASAAVHLNAQGGNAHTFLNLEWAHKALGLKITPETGLVTVELNPIASATGKINSSQSQYDGICRASITTVLKLGVKAVLCFGAYGLYRWMHDTPSLKDDASGFHVLGTERKRINYQGTGKDVRALKVTYVRATGEEARDCNVLFARHPCLDDSTAIMRHMAVVHELDQSAAADAARIQSVMCNHVVKVGSCPRFEGPPVPVSNGALQRVVNIVIDAEAEEDKRYLIARDGGVGIVTHNCDYVHRVGRTGRAGKQGTAITFIEPSEIKFAPELVHGLIAAKQVVPADLQKMADEFEQLRKEGKVKYASNDGYSSAKGFKFDETEAAETKEKQRLRNLVDNPDADLDELEAVSDDARLIEEKRSGKKDAAAAAAAAATGAAAAGGAATAAAAGGAATPASAQEQKRAPSSSPPPAAAMDPIARQLAIAKQAAMAAARAMAAQSKQMLLGGGDSQSAQLADQKVVSAMQAAREAEAQRQAREATAAAAAKAAAIAAQLSRGKAGTGGSSGSAPGGVGVDGEEKRAFFSEIEINDYPQHARWKVTHKGALDSVIDLTDCAVTTKGGYIPPGRNALPGERKLHLLVEGNSEVEVQRCKAEIIRMLEEAAADSRPDAPVKYAKYSVV